MPCLLPWRVGEFASTLAGLGVPLRHTRRPVLRESVRGAGSCLCGGGFCLPSACRPCGLAGAAEMIVEVCSSRVALVCGAVVQREMGPDRGRSVVVAKAKSAGGRLYCCPCAVVRESYYLRQAALCLDVCRFWPGERWRPSGPRPRGDNPLNLSILISGGKETNRDSPSKGD